MRVSLTLLPLLLAMAHCQVAPSPEPISIEELLREATVVSLLEEAKADEEPFATDAAATENEEINLISLAARPKPSSGPVPVDLSQVPVVEVAATTPPPTTVSPLRQRFRLISNRNRQPFRPRPRLPPLDVNQVEPSQPRAPLQQQQQQQQEEEPSRNTLFTPRRRFRPRPRPFFGKKTDEAEEEAQQESTTAAPTRPPLTGRRSSFTGLLRRPRPTSQIVASSRRTTTPEPTTTTTATTTQAPTTTPAPTTTTTSYAEPTTTYYYELEEEEVSTPAPTIRLLVQNPREGLPFPDPQPTTFVNTFPSSSARARQGPPRSAPTAAVASAAPVVTSTRARRPVPRQQQQQPTAPVPTSQVPLRRTTARRRRPVAVAEPVIAAEVLPTAPVEAAPVAPSTPAQPLTTRQKILATKRARQKVPRKKAEPATLNEVPRRSSVRKANKVPRRLVNNADPRRVRPRPGNRRRKPVAPVVVVEEVEEEVATPTVAHVAPTKEEAAFIAPTVQTIAEPAPEVATTTRVQPTVEVLRFQQEEKVLLEPVVVTNRFEPKQLRAQPTSARAPPTAATFTPIPSRETARTRVPASTLNTHRPGVFTFQNTFGTFEPAVVTVPISPNTPFLARTTSATTTARRVPAPSAPASTARVVAAAAAEPTRETPTPTRLTLSPAPARASPTPIAPAIRRGGTEADPANLIDPSSAPAPAAVVPTRPSVSRNTVPVQLPRKFAVTKPAKKLLRNERVRVVDRYRSANDDGSITWGYKSADGSFKEETIGADCITRGRYGYVDPQGEIKEYTYESGLECDPLTKQPLNLPLPRATAFSKSVGAKKGSSASRRGRPSKESLTGYYDYNMGKFVFPDGRTAKVVVNKNKMARG